MILIYREDRYNPEAENDGVAEIIVAKQRNGPTDTVKLAFIKERTRFENFDPERALTARMVRSTVAHVDLAALQANYRAIEALLAARTPPARRPPDVIAVVKANAYGHGARHVALALEQAGRPRWRAPTSKKASCCGGPASTGASSCSAR